MSIFTKKKSPPKNSTVVLGHNIPPQQPNMPPSPPLTPLHKQRSRVSRLTASASVSTISPTDALEEHFMAVNSEQLCTGTTANVALKS